MRNVLTSIACGIVFVLTCLGGAWLYQRETAIIRNQDALAQAVSRHEESIKQVVGFLNQQIQASQKAATAPDAKVNNG